MAALILLIILGVDWASGYAIAGYCMTHGVSPYGYAFWQAFGPFVLLLIIQCLRREVWLARNAAFYALLCGLFGIVIPNLLIYLVARYIPSGILTVIANISPVFTYLLAVAFRDEGFNLSRMLLVIVGLLGLGLLILPSSLIAASASSWFQLLLGNYWFYLALFIPLSYSFSAVYISRFHPGEGSVLAYALWMLMFASLCISPLAVISGGYYPLRVGDLNSGLIVLEIILSSCGYVLLFIILKMVGAVYYSLVNAVAAISGLAYGYFLFGQKFTSLTYLALTIIVITIAGLTYTQSQQRR